MLYTFRYIGNKHQFLEKIIKRIVSFRETYDTFVDVFGGSGVVSLNVSHLFKNVILNDIDTNVMCVHNAFKNMTWNDYRSFCKRTHIDTIDLSDKETFYKFRDKGNKEFYFQDGNSIDKGLFLYFISGACINSFFRVGPNGFNQSSGQDDLSRRFSYMRWRTFHKAYLNIELSCQDYKNLCLSVDKPCTWFLDPPYSSMSNTYDSNFSKEQKKEFLKIVTSELKGNIIYTDAYDKEEWKLLKDYGFEREMLRKDMPNISVGCIGNGGNKTTGKIEVMYYRQSFINY